MEKDNAGQQLESKKMPLKEKRPYAAPAIIHREFLEAVAVICPTDQGGKSKGQCAIGSS